MRLNLGARNNIIAMDVIRKISKEQIKYSDKELFV